MRRVGGQHFTSGNLSGVQGGREEVSAGQCGRDIQRRFRSLRWILAQTRQDDGFDLGVDLWHELGGWAWLHGLVESKILEDVVGIEGGPAREHFIQHKTQRINIALLVDRYACQLLRSHVARRARPNLASFHLPGDDGQSEVGDPNTALLIDHDIGRFQVAMQYAMNVGGRQTRTELTGDVDGSRSGQSADSSQKRGQVFAVDVLHRDERRPIDLSEIVNSADVRMTHFARELDFTLHAAPPSRVQDMQPGQKFQRDGLMEPIVLRPIDPTHRPLAEQRDDAIAVGDQITGLKRRWF